MTNAEYKVYHSFVSDFFPKSYFHKNNKSEKEEFFNVLNQSIVFIDSLMNIQELKNSQKLFLKQIELQFKKILYVVPGNDDFQFKALMRALSENFLRLFLATEKEVSYNDIINFGFRNLKKEIKGTNGYNKHKKYIDILFGHFGEFSQDIHNKNKDTGQTFSYLVELMTSPPDMPLNKKLKILYKYKELIVYMVFPLLNANTRTLTTEDLVRINNVIGQRAFETLPIS